jgi:hypothetical protein
MRQLPKCEQMEWRSLTKRQYAATKSGATDSDVGDRITWL